MFFRAVSGALSVPFLAEVEPAALVMRDRDGLAALRADGGVRTARLHESAGRSLILVAPAAAQTADERRQIGWVEQRGRLIYELDRAANLESFRLRLSHLGTFGGDKPRALYAGVENNEALQRLQASHERILRRVVLTPDARKFVPHVSLARLRGTSAIEVCDRLRQRTALSLCVLTITVW